MAESPAMSFFIAQEPRNVNHGKRQFHEMLFLCPSQEELDQSAPKYKKKLF